MAPRLAIVSLVIFLFLISTSNRQPISAAPEAGRSTGEAESWFGNVDGDFEDFNVVQRTCALDFILRSAVVELPAAKEDVPTPDLTKLVSPPASPKVACAAHVTGPLHDK